MSKREHGGGGVQITGLKNFVGSPCRQLLSIGRSWGKGRQSLLTKLADQVVVSAICLLVMSSGCRREMYDQPYSKPLKSSDFFLNRMASRPVVPNTVARGHLNTDEA